MLSRKIPFTAKKYIAACRRDAIAGNYAKDPNDYLEFLIAATKKKNPHLLEYLRVVDRQTGQPRYYGQADHIVPRAVWAKLMPDYLLGPDKTDKYSGALSNLFWRDPFFNASCDQPAITHVLTESGQIKRNTAKWQAWSEKWIQIFLRTKRDEGVLFAGEPVDPFFFDTLPEK